MGHGMAKNIVEKGYALAMTGHRNRKPIEDLVGRGAVEVTSAKEVAERSSIVFLCVTGSPEVEAIIRGQDGLEGRPEAGFSHRRLLDIRPHLHPRARRGTRSGRRRTLPTRRLSRTPKEAWEGKLDTMVGARDEVFARIKPVIETWAGKIVHIGGIGDGHRMKLLNNFISLGYAAIYAEALTLASKVGISPERFDSVIRGGRMDCGFYQTFMGYTIEGNREAHKFTSPTPSRILRYLESMADAAKLLNPVGNAVKNSFAMAYVAAATVLKTTFRTCPNISVAPMA